MPGHDRYEFEDRDEYEEEELNEVTEIEHETEELKPSKEEIEYLQLRERLKEQIRKKTQKENGFVVSNSKQKKKKDNYGSFFGPSQPVIAHRVIEESKLLLVGVSNSFSSKNATSASANKIQQSRVHEEILITKNELKTKVQKLKDGRDYSFLFSNDVDIPAPEPVPQSSSSLLRSEAQSAPVSQNKQPHRNGITSIHHRHGRKPPPLNSPTHSKPMAYTSASSSKHPMDSRKQPIDDSVIGHSGFGGGGGGSKNLHSARRVAAMGKATMPGFQNTIPLANKHPMSKMQSGNLHRHSEMKGMFQETSKAKVGKHPASFSKPMPSARKSHTPLQDGSPRKKPVRNFCDDEYGDDGEEALSIIRKMFNTQRFAGRDDRDICMEANFDDIMMEEKRSAKLARKEDEEQLRLIEQEEHEEQMRFLAKKRKQNR